jgi:four helix bundle protein
MRDFRKYLVWEQSHKLTLEIYSITKTFPSDEKYGLSSQIRRACSSIPTNIAEGCGKISEKDFARYLGISFGSASELEYLILLSKDLNFIDNEKYELLQHEIVSIKKQLYHLINKINAV